MSPFPGLSVSIFFLPPVFWPCLCVCVGVFISNALLYLQWGSEINPWGSRAGKAAQWVERKPSDKLLNVTSRSVTAMFLTQRTSPSQPFLSLSFPSAPSPSLVMPGWAGDELPLCKGKENAVCSRADPHSSFSVVSSSPF